MPRHRILAALGLITFGVGCDQGTKRIAEQTLRDHAPLAWLHGSVRLMYAENTGAWGSLGASWPQSVKCVVFIILPLIAVLAGAVYALRWRATSWTELIAWALIISGLGNVVDRARLGHVVDFMWLGVGPLATNIFNVADVAVVAGCALLMVHGARSRTRSVEAPDQS